MPIELIQEHIGHDGTAFGSTTSRSGEVSVWAVHNGPPGGGFMSSAQIEQRGLAFGNNERSVVKALRKGEVSKGKQNIVIGPSGQQYAEYIFDAKELQERDQSFQRQANSMEGRETNRSTSDTEGVTVNASKIQDEVIHQQLLETA